MKTNRANIQVLQILAVLFFIFPALASTQELWSLQPVQSPSLPPVREPALCRTPIDLFVLSRLEANGLGLRPEADRRTLIRRLTLDLHGVPPTPEEIDSFVHDPSPQAWENLVDRLLGSPRYGERWARHWLDVARFTESQGFEYDHLRPNAWHYRDYVIRSLNADKPYDQFVREQIAGDVLQPDSAESIIATSLLVCGPYDQAGNAQANQTQKAISREDEMEDLISTVTQGFLGITVNCARCHSHKFDPVPQEDYYRIKAVFEGVRHGERPIVRRAEISARETEITALKAQTPDSKERDRLIQALKPLPVSYTGVRQQPSPTKVLKRGDVKSPGDVVHPGGLSAISQLPSDFGLAPESLEDQRRLRFGEWLTDRQNPLTPRVIANRVWLYHFGQGIVTTPSDFGNSGAKPSHPELLDWLANYLIQENWSLKALHRVIVCSAVYRQSSALDERVARVDSDNQWLWRFKPIRLEAEVVRDSMLAVSGSMNWQMGGPSFRPFDIVTFNSSSYFPKDVRGPEFDRRTIYRANVNSGKDPLLDLLDCPDPSVRTPRRMATITPGQALSLMNNPFVQRQAVELARRVSAETSSPRAALDRAFEYTLGRKPLGDEQASLLNECQERGLSTSAGCSSIRPSFCMFDDPHRLLPRRHFLWNTAGGIGGLALAWMLNRETRAARDNKTRESTSSAPTPHFPPRARRVVQIFCAGGVSHIDTFDFKPELEKLHGKTLEGKGENKGFFGQPGKVMKSPYEFRRYGQSGHWVSSLLPRLASCVDDVSFIHSMVAKSNNHTPATFQMNSGFTMNGFPCMGAWISYGLGSENEDLPAFVVLPDSRGHPAGGSINWTAGFLPAKHQGVSFRTNTAMPVVDLKTPDSVSPSDRLQDMRLLARMNQNFADENPGESDFAARLRSYELAARMQLSIPEVTDLSREPAHIRKLYGLEDKRSEAFGRNCLLARRLLERGVRFVQLFNGGAFGSPRTNWDGHENVFENHNTQAATMDQPAAALLKDLKDRGMLDDTLFIWNTEFGRGPATQGIDSPGRDHHPDAFTCFLAGAGVKSGFSYGASDEAGYFASENPVTIYDLHATILHLLGIDHEKLTFYHNGINRRLTDVHGKVVHALLA